MGSSKFLVAAMTETLMPEDLGGVGGERLHMAGVSGGEKRVGAWRWPIRGNNWVKKIEGANNGAGDKDVKR